MEATEFTEEINWHASVYDEPPITREIPQDILMQISVTGLFLDERWVNFPWHSEAEAIQKQQNLCWGVKLEMAIYDQHYQPDQICLSLIQKRIMHQTSNFN